MRGGETPPTPPLPPAAWRGPSLRRPGRGLLLLQAQRGGHGNKRREWVCGGETPPTPPLPPAAWQGPSLRRPGQGLCSRKQRNSDAKK